MKQIILASTLFFTLSAEATTAFFVTYKDNFLHGGQGVTARLMKVTDIDDGQPKSTHYDLRLPEAHHSTAGNFQYLTRMKVIDNNHVIFLCPNGHLYCFTLPEQSTTHPLENKAHLSLGRLDLGYWSQASWYNVILPLPGCSLKQYSPVSASRAFKNSSGQTCILIASDEYTYTLKISMPSYGTVTSPVSEEITTLDLKPLSSPLFNIKDSSWLYRQHYSSSLELITEKTGSIYAIATMNPHYPQPAGRESGAPFLMYQLELNNTSGSWQQAQASTYSAQLPFNFDTHGSAIIHPDKPKKNYSNGVIYRFCTDPKQQGLSCFELSNHQYCVLYNPATGSIDSQASLTNGKQLIRVCGPRSHASEEGFLEGDRDKAKFYPRMAAYNGQLYSLVARNIPNEQATYGMDGHKLCLVKASLPSSEELQESETSYFKTPKKLDWENVCDIPLPSTAEAFSYSGTQLQRPKYFPEAYDDFMLFNPDDIKTIDISGL